MTPQLLAEYIVYALGAAALGFLLIAFAGLLVALIVGWARHGSSVQMPKQHPIQRNRGEMK